MHSEHSITAYDAVLALAFIGDLSMGRPTDHSSRTGWLAAQLMATLGSSDSQCHAARLVSLLRWSGCTANAAGFDQLFGDDVGGRDAMLTHTLSVAAPEMQRRIHPLAQIHCEVSGDIAVTLGMPAEVEAGLRHIFETFDGQGMPQGLRGEQVPALVYCVALASDLEIMARAHGLEAALRHIANHAERKYPRALAALLQQHGGDWLAQLDEHGGRSEAPATLVSGAQHQVPLTLVADVIDLKLPWMAGYSRAVAELGAAAVARQGLGSVQQAQVYRAALIHGAGRAALPNALWNTPGKLLDSDRERMRLAPYWTSRAARQTSALGGDGELASHVYERLDGSGAFRGVGGEALSTLHRTLAAAAAWTALRCVRPWRPALEQDQAIAVLRQEAAQGKFDGKVLDAVLASVDGRHTSDVPKSPALLSERELDVLRRISLGESSKEVARVLVISPSTVRTHVESIFRKLDCSTRAAATLKAFTLGLL